MSARRAREDLEWVVRIFADYADSPVWSIGPWQFEDMHLSSELERDLRAFEARYYEVQDPNHGYAVHSEFRRSHEREGERLAQALALEIGSPFAVRVIHPEGGSGSRTYRSTSPATNQLAHEAFRAEHDENSH